MTLPLDMQLKFESSHALIELVREVIGVHLEPSNHRELIDPDVEATAILARADLRVTSRSQRAAHRLVLQEIKRQENIEAITTRAIEELAPGGTEPEQEVELDWARQFFDFCQDVSDAFIQVLWAKVLAAEFEKPGRFSLRTLAIVNELRRQDAELFERFCGYCWYDGNELVPVLSHRDLGEQSTVSLSRLELAQLRSLGLIENILPAGFSIKLEQFDLHYHGWHSLSLPTWMDHLAISPCLLTRQGQELAPLMGSVPNEPYQAATVADWRWRGIHVIEYAKE